MSIKGADIKYEKQVSADDVINEANSIWNELRRRRIHPDDSKTLDAFYSEMVEQHVELTRSYPIVMRYMCQLGCYNEKALRYFIKKMIDKPSRSEENYLDLQAEYVKMLYIETKRACGQKWDAKTAALIYNDARKRLQEEADRFKEIAKKYAEEKALKEDKYKQLNLDGFAQFLEENKTFFETDGNIPIRTNINSTEMNTEKKLKDKMSQIEVDDEDIIKF